ncbi:hypothetical protein [Methylobacter luteus]|uniref:hypothetical protein n=1 Tax=Methylobacter luteus TaxID=415 RepID=UPI0004207572|nr:hypothetical protein [Methylobacter luteus]
MKNMLIMAVALLMLSAATTSPADSENTNGSEPGNGNSFIGLWEAVDPRDGSHLILSITSNDDGTVKLLVYDTFWTLCNGDRGIAQGTSEVSAEQSLKSDDYAITCFETGDTTVVPIALTRNSDGTLARVGPAPLTPLIIYHRTSK